MRKVLFCRDKYRWKCLHSFTLALSKFRFICVHRRMFTYLNSAVCSNLFCNKNEIEAQCCLNCGVLFCRKEKRKGSGTKYEKLVKWELLTRRRNTAHKLNLLFQGMSLDLNLISSSDQSKTLLNIFENEGKIVKTLLAHNEWKVYFWYCNFEKVVSAVYAAIEILSSMQIWPWKMVVTTTSTNIHQVLLLYISTLMITDN